MLKLLEKSQHLPVSLLQVKTHLRLDHGASDDHLTELISAATQWVENYIGRSILRQKWLQSWYADQQFSQTISRRHQHKIYILLARTPLIDVSRVCVENREGHQKIIHHYDIDVRHDAPYLILHEHYQKIDVTYWSGFGEVGAHVPDDLKLAILTLAAHHYDQPGLVNPRDLESVEHYLQPYKTIGLS